MLNKKTSALQDIGRPNVIVIRNNVPGDYGENVETERPIGDDIPTTDTTPETMTIITEAGTDPSPSNQVNATKAGSVGELR